MRNNARNKQVNRLVTCAAMIALNIILTRFTSIQTPFVRIDFGFVAMAVAGMLMGPFYGMAVGGISDFLGASLFPSAQFHPGFTLTATLVGLSYGLLIHRRENEPEWSRAKFMFRSALAVGFNCFVLGLCLNPLWLTQMYDKAYLVLLPTRVVKEAVMFAVQLSVVNLIRMALVEPMLRRFPHAG